MANATGSTLFPNAEQLQDTIRGLTSRLETSLKHILLDVWQSPENKARAERMLEQIFADNALPGSSVFAAHDAMLDSALTQDEDGFEQVCAMFMRIREPYAGHEFQVLGLSEDALGKSDCVFLRRAFRDDLGMTSDLAAPAPDEAKNATATIDQARKIMHEYAPAWASEFDMLVSRVYLAMNRDKQKNSFHGATVFSAFGSILVNFKNLGTLATTLITLVHESSHARLFLFHLDDPVILNEDTELYRSPLRSTLRPMEGIFHAAWVSARMAKAAEHILNNGYSGTDAEKLCQLGKNAAAAFHKGVTEIESHARLTPLGQQILDDAVKAMSNAQIQ